MAQHGKKYLESARQFDSEKLYDPAEALGLVKQLATAKFDETVEVHMRLGIDARQADQQMRGVILMPAGLGKTVRILVFAEGEAARLANEAGADIVGGDDIIERIQTQNFLDFDIAIGVPEMMGKVGRIARILGPRGLMPSPKAGTVVQAQDLARVIEESRAGRAEYRNDKTGNLHVAIGKVSFTPDALQQNFNALMEEIRRVRPASVKGIFVRKLVVTSTM
ncbi:MAG: 50S ribosomal protein L1, partial [Anaerolineae bacterium]|nr:50S ribosomal protein L1 [Anaerolineae bacterium]